MEGCTCIYILFWFFLKILKNLWTPVYPSMQLYGTLLLSMSSWTLTICSSSFFSASKLFLKPWPLSALFNYRSLPFIATISYGLDQVEAVWTTHQIGLHRVLLDVYPQISCSDTRRLQWWLTLSQNLIQLLHKATLYIEKAIVRNCCARRQERKPKRLRPDIALPESSWG